MSDTMPVQPPPGPQVKPKQLSLIGMSPSSLKSRKPKVTFAPRICAYILCRKRYQPGKGWQKYCCPMHRLYAWMLRQRLDPRIPADYAEIGEVGVGPKAGGE
jgi:hypothetical protein